MLESSDEDLKNLGLPKGARVKALEWISARQSVNGQAVKLPETLHGSESALPELDREKASKYAPKAFAEAVKTLSPSIGQETFGSAGDAAKLPLPDSFCCPISFALMEDPCMLWGGMFITGL